MTEEENGFARRVIEGLPADYQHRNNVTVIGHIDPDTVPREQRQ